MSLFLHIHPRDNVAVALRDLAAQSSLSVSGRKIVLQAAVPRGHKFALEAIPSGGLVLKFGQPIGHARQGIAPGEHVHVHNLGTNLSGTLEYRYEPAHEQERRVDDGLCFDGYERSDGEVGIRNEVWVLPTVGCVNEIAQALARKRTEKGLPANVDGIHAFPHPYGCSQLGEDHVNTQKILARLARHPNAGAVLIVGLGCENNTMKSFKELLGPVDSRRYRFMVAQDFADEMATGLSLLDELVEEASRARRKPASISRLRIGLKCGGSDGLSGITANPLVGALSDKLVERGGSTLLTEVPEMFGAEGLFMNRCASRQVFDECVGMINGFKEYFLRHNQVVYENPSPGNKDGGISTLEEKSLGCLQKGGSSIVMDILPYAGAIRKQGLSFLAGPGNDIVSVTGMSAAGVHLVLFTTGRGTPLGGPVPTVKIATNNELAQKKAGWIDFNAGRLLEGATLSDLSDELLHRLLEIASGRVRTRNEINGFREIAIFKDGVTL
jgi:altronate hydrolase